LVVRVVAAILAAAIGSLVLAALFTSDSAPGWLNAVFQLAGFLAATLIADRIAPQRALLAVTVGIAGTWGVMAVWMLAISERRLSFVIVLCYVIASLALAFVLDLSRSRAKRVEG
jgi:hypothetical protein